MGSSTKYLGYGLGIRVFKILCDDGYYFYCYTYSVPLSYHNGKEEKELSLFKQKSAILKLEERVPGIVSN